MLTRAPFEGSNNLGDLYIIKLLGAVEGGVEGDWGNFYFWEVAAVKYKNWSYNLKPKVSKLPFHV